MIVTTLLALIAAAGSTIAAPAVGIPTAESGRALVSTLGESATAGLYIDEAGSFVIPVTTDAAADAVTEAGFVAKKVEHSMAKLNSIKSYLDTTASDQFVGSGWHVDPISNRVVISVDSELAKSPKLENLKSAAAAYDGAIKFEFVNGTLTTYAAAVSGGAAIYSSVGRCSLGVNVRVGSTYYFLTAGHCGSVGTVFYRSSSTTSANRLGTVTRRSFPGSDYAIVAYDSATTGLTSVGNVGSQDITVIGAATVGQRVSRRGSTTGVHTGSVTALGASVTYAEGTVRGLIRTTVCAEPGDSGGSLYASTTSLGMTSGGSGDCTSGGVTYFQPANVVANLIGASAY
ncbi:peptidase S1 and S6 chymotrypsin/Hap [Cladochytrium replicatum]|nr:peptidase S1 and S6 chymotrypsin/Hap [Cladochytrium replicatum]